MKALAGIDHVGIGSDYDGVGDSLPTGLKDVSMYPNLIYELLKRDYSEEAVSYTHLDVYKRQVKYPAEVNDPGIWKSCQDSPLSLSLIHI